MATKNETDGGKNCRQFQSSSPSTPVTGGGRQAESYFDTHPWFDSDGEEFHSVNGDFGSSRSFSPIIIDERIASKFEQEPQPVQPPISTWNPNERRKTTTSRSSSSVKKRLSDFFSESFNRDLEFEIESERAQQQHPSSSYVDNYSPSTSTDRTSSSPHDQAVSKQVFSDHEMSTGKKKSVAKRACIPSLMRSLSCGGGTRKRRPGSRV